jgi:triacylglycerol esterase/lipase EstA (alpha/beta hydrolase family)
MMPLKLMISQLVSDSLVLCSSVNESSTRGNIEDMALAFAGEVHDYVEEYCSLENLRSLNFVGHSLGGIIIRAALPYLNTFAAKMGTFLTLSTPHLGYMYKSSKLVNIGMWVLKN